MAYYPSYQNGIFSVNHAKKTCRLSYTKAWCLLYQKDLLLSYQKDLSISLKGHQVTLYLNYLAKEGIGLIIVYMIHPTVSSPII